jgi:hypothetical protein
VRVGTPFNPYKLFRGVFAPYWLLEHRGLSTGAKLCYIRLLGLTRGQLRWSMPKLAFALPTIQFDGSKSWFSPRFHMKPP